MSDTKNLNVNDIEKFAEDIVTCVMQRRHSDWVPSDSYQKGEIILQYQDDIIDFCTDSELDLRNEWWQYFNGREKSVENYEKFCKVVASIVSHMQFSVGKLLVQVLKLSEFAAHLYNTGCKEAPSIAAKHIGDILLKFPEFFEVDPSEKQFLSELRL